MSDRRSAALNARAWPFEEARKVLKRLGDKHPAKGYALFETGYGPSGLPHIGTFGEVARTSMVRHAFAQISDIPSKLFAFSDDMDGLRKVPDNIPHLGGVVEDLAAGLLDDVFKAGVFKLGAGNQLVAVVHVGFVMFAAVVLQGLLGHVRRQSVEGIG